MNQTLGLFLAISSMVMMGLANAMSKKPAEQMSATRLVFWRGAFNSAILFLILLFTTNIGDLDLKWIGITVIIGFFGYWPLYFFYKAMAVGIAGLVSPVAASYAILTTFLSVIIYRESLSPLRLLLILLIVSGIILTSINLRAFRDSHLFQAKSGLPFAILAALGWGIYFFIIKLPIEHLGPIPFSFTIEFVIFLMAWLFIRSERKEGDLPKIKMISIIFWMSILTVFGVLAYYQGIKIYSLSIMTAIAAAGPLIVCLYGAIVYKEKLTLQQYSAIAIIVGSIIALSIVR